MKRTSFLSVIIFASSFFILTCNERQPDATNPPNIILIVADDLGYGGLSSYGDPGYRTPNIDRLAREGLKFTDFHSNAPVCTPTRAALLTGRYQQRSGLEGVIYVRGETRQTGLANGELTIAELLKSAGYRTGIMGKWHLGYREKFNPVYQGFDRFYGYVSGNIDYFSHYDNAGIYDWWHNSDSLYEEGYSTDLITQHSLDFIENNVDRRFFLYVAHEAPHVPFQARTDSAYRYPGREFSYLGPVKDRKNAYAGMMQALDEGVGEIVDKVIRAGLQENTLIIFCSDNGGLEGYGNNGRLRGSKSTLWEGGHRVPAIAWWPDRIDPVTTGQTTMSFDIFPTFLQLAGVNKPDTLQLDGVSLVPLLFDGEPLPERDLFWRYRGQKAARRGPWKLMLTSSDTLLFNLEKDISEKQDLSIQHPKKRNELLSALRKWERDVMQGVSLRTD